MKGKIKRTRIEKLLEMLSDELSTGSLSNRPPITNTSSIGMPPFLRIREIATALETEYEIEGRTDSSPTARLLAKIMQELNDGREVEEKKAHATRLIWLLNDTELKRKAGMWRTKK